MSRRRSALALLTALVLSLLAGAFAGSASAGGPTSVLLVVPGSGHTASLYTGSADYEELTRLVGMYEGRSGPTTPSEGMDVGSGVTITWLIHDAQVWRVDRVDLSPADGPMISTQESMGEGSIWDQPVRRHAATEGKALVALLDRLGLGVNGLPAQAATEPQAVQSFFPATVSDTTPVDQRSGLHGWAWWLAGVVFGVAATLGVVLFVRSRSFQLIMDDDDDATDLELLDSQGRPT